MILEKETFEAFGYYPRNLKLHSMKRILVACNDCGKVRITSKNGYHTLCKSCSQSGNKNHNYGKTGKDSLRFGIHHTKEAKLLISKNHADFKGDKNPMFGKCHEGNKNPMYGKHHSAETRAKLSAAAIKQRRSSPPEMTAPEKAFRAICRKYDLPFTFVGNGALWLGNANPDFVHNTKKIVVEVFGDYWHSPFLRKVRYNETVEGRTKQLKKEGYKLIVLWESDLKRKDVEAFVLYVLKKEKVI